MRVVTLLNRIEKLKSFVYKKAFFIGIGILQRFALACSSLAAPTHAAWG